MKPKRFHGLRRPKLRQSWNKYNLFNISRAREGRLGVRNSDTFFQQKWRAKGVLRGYHGEHIPERKWERMFSRRLLGAVRMDAQYMAAHDGSEMSAGRGSGRDLPDKFSASKVPSPTLTPYMQMAFAPMERRLDIAVFRAMFASSARQARQFCVHGAVKVNGKVMNYPAYRLNPGDMFQVDPDRVLYATGASKRPAKKARSKKPASSATEEEDTDAPVEEETGAPVEDSEKKAAEPQQDPDTTDAPEEVPVDMKPTRKQVQGLAQQAKAILSEEVLSVAQKQKLRKFIRSMRPVLAHSGRTNASPAQVADELANLVKELDLNHQPSNADATTTTPSQENPASSDPLEGLDKFQLKELEKRMAEHLREEEENPLDPSKPYVTPWRPRNYLSPFAFIPKYLEVNQKICSAVYLRHPVARAGRAEVPTPYPYYVNQLAFNWYLKRR